MPRVKLKSYQRLGELDDPESGEVVVVIDLVPRGSGNRNMARRLADEFRDHEVLGVHLLEVRAGASRVTLHFRPTWEAMKAMWEWTSEGKRAGRDNPDQLKLAWSEG